MAETIIQEVLPKGKNVIITGGYGYLGKAITESLAHYGANVFVAARNEQKFSTIFEHHKNVHFIECDISSSESIERAFKEFCDGGNKLDGLINNAFYARGQSPTEMSRADFTFTLDGCLSSVFDCIKHAMPIMSEGGSIINVSSMYGMIAPDFNVYETSPEYLNPPHYGAAKAAIIQLTKYYASFLGERGVRVNAVTPGPFPNTTVQKNDEFISELKKRTLINRFGLPQDLAGIFGFLISNSSSFITGQNFVVDGGWSVR
jgi:gluconate 5-dehydrogenase